MNVRNNLSVFDRMFLFLPFLFFFLLAVFLKRKSPATLWREVFLFSFLVLGVLVFLSTEILSLFKMFNFGSLCVFWAAAGAVVLILNIRARGNREWGLPDIPSFSVMEKTLLILIVLEAALLLFIALIVPPSTWDAMTYHMGRVAHWIQNSTVAYYPTNIQRQLFYSPFPEYWIAHIQILLKGYDYCANTVQWLSMAGSLLGISLISREIGLSRLGQILSAFLVITLPNAIVEATSTQTDFVATLWSVIGVYFFLKSIKYGQTKNVVAAAVAVFLAFYTKGTTLFVLVPFMVWMIIDGFTIKIRQPSAVGWKIGCHIGLVVLAAALSLGIPLVKNSSLLGSPVFSAEKGHILSITAPKSIISNHLLHWGMHLRLGINPIDDAVTAAAVEKIHNLMGLTTQTSPANGPGYSLNYVDFPFYEDEIPNCIFSVVFLFCVGGFLIFRRREWGTFKGTFFLMTFACLFIFNSLLRWTPFDGRYHLAFFILLAPFVADIFAVRKKWLPVLAVIFAVLTVPFLFFNSSKPFVGGNIELFYKKEPKYGGPSILKTEWKNKYFYNRPGIAVSTIVAINGMASSGCRQIGLKISEESWEYVFWAYLQQSRQPFRIEHVLVDNASQALEYPLGKFSPCLILTDEPKEYFIHDGKFFVMGLNTGDYKLFVPAESM